MIYLRQQLATSFEKKMISPALTPQSGFLLSDNANHDESIINHFVLIFKLYVYNSREETSSKHNELTYRHQKNKKRQNILSLPTVKKKRNIY